MTLIIKCEGSCGKSMGSLEPFKVIQDKYMCLECANKSEVAKETNTLVEDFYDNLDPADIPYIGFHRHEIYRNFQKYGYVFISSASYDRFLTESLSISSGTPDDKILDVFKHDTNKSLITVSKDVLSFHLGYRPAEWHALLDIDYIHQLLEQIQVN